MFCEKAVHHRLEEILCKKLRDRLEERTAELQQAKESSNTDWLLERLDVKDAEMQRFKMQAYGAYMHLKDQLSTANDTAQFYRESSDVLHTLLKTSFTINAVQNNVPDSLRSEIDQMDLVNLDAKMPLEERQKQENERRRNAVEFTAWLRRGYLDLQVTQLKITASLFSTTTDLRKEIARLQATIEEREETIAQHQAAMKERDEMIAQHDAAMNERDDIIARL